MAVTRVESTCNVAADDLGVLVLLELVHQLLDGGVRSTVCALRMLLRSHCCFYHLFVLENEESFSKLESCLGKTNRSETLGIVRITFLCSFVNWTYD